MHKLSYINKLRVLASLAIVLVHVADSGLLPYKTADYLTLDWWVVTFSNAVARWGSPTFVMISGALLLNPYKEEGILAFYRRRAWKVVIPLGTWTIIYFGVRHFMDGHLTPMEMVGNLLRGRPYYHLWFFYMVPALYLFTPFFRSYLRNTPRIQRYALIGIIFAVAWVQTSYTFFFGEDTSTIFTMFLPYIAYYLAGYELRSIDISIFSLRRLALIVLGCITANAIGVAALSWFLDGNLPFYFYMHFSPFAIVLAISMMLLVRLADQHIAEDSLLSRIVNHIAPTTTGIYLIHPLLIRFLFDSVVLPASSLLAIVSLLFALYAICHLIVFGMMKLPLVRYTVS